MFVIAMISTRTIYANAVERPVLNSGNAIWYSVVAMVWVAWASAVMMRGYSKTRTASMVRKIRAMSSKGHTIGSVICRNLNQAEAWSTSAASYRYLGTAESPASEISSMKGVHCHTSTIASAMSEIF